MRLFILAVATTLCLTGVTVERASAQQGGLADQLTVPPPPQTATGPAVEAEIRYAAPDAYGLPTPSSSAAPDLRIPSRITTRLRALDANLQVLGARGNGHIINAVISMALGGAVITLGILQDSAMSPFLYILGGTQAARGILSLALTPDVSGAAIAFQHMPMESREEVRERLEFGEGALSGTAEQALILRVIDGSLSIASGVAVIPAYLAPNDWEINDPFGYLTILLAATSAVMGIITLASPTSAERRWDAYQEMRQRLADEREDERALRRGAGEDLDELSTLIPGPAPNLRLSPLGVSARF